MPLDNNMTNGIEKSMKLYNILKWKKISFFLSFLNSKIY